MGAVECWAGRGVILAGVSGRVRRRTGLGTALLLFAALAAAPVAAQRPREGMLQVGQPVPPCVLTDLQGTNPVDLSTLRGKPHVLIFGSCT